jgi:hypothetical protein
MVTTSYQASADRLDKELRTNEDFLYITGPRSSQVRDEIKRSGARSAVIFGANHQVYAVGEQPRPGSKVAVLFHQSLIPHRMRVTKGGYLSQIQMSADGHSDQPVIRSNPEDGYSHERHVAYVTIPKHASKFRVRFHADDLGQRQAYDNFNRGFDLLNPGKTFRGIEVRRDFKKAKVQAYSGDPVTLYFAVRPSRPGEQIERVWLRSQSEGMPRPADTELKLGSQAGPWLNYQSSITPTASGRWDFQLVVKRAGEATPTVLEAGRYHAKLNSGKEDWQKGPVAREVDLDFLRKKGVRLGKLYVGSLSAAAIGAKTGRLPGTGKAGRPETDQPLGCTIDMVGADYEAGKGVKHVSVPQPDGAHHAFNRDGLIKGVRAAIAQIEGDPDRATIVHCHAGKGRAPTETSVILKVLAERHGVKMGLAEAFTRVSKARNIDTYLHTGTDKTLAGINFASILPPPRPLARPVPAPKLLTPAAKPPNRPALPPASPSPASRSQSRWKRFLRWPRK